MMVKRICLRVCGDVRLQVCNCADRVDHSALFLYHHQQILNGCKWVVLVFKGWNFV